MHSKKYRVTDARDMREQALSDYDLKIELDNTKQMVSGPVATYRLEGTINGVKKVVYLFMDLHLHLGNQRECSNVFSKDINRYIFENFEGAQKSDNGITYDFFLEFDAPETVRSRHGKTTTSENTDHYIEYLSVLFRNLLRFDENNNVKPSDLFKNVRFHYGDVREFFNAGDSVIRQLYFITDSMKTNDKLESGYLDQIIDLSQTILEVVTKYMNIIKQAMSRKKGIKLKYIATEHYRDTLANVHDPVLYEGFIYFLNKILYKYNDDNIRQKLFHMILSGYCNIRNFFFKMEKFRKLSQSALYISHELTIPVEDRMVKYEGLYNDKVTSSDIVYDIEKRASDLNLLNTRSRMWFMDVFLLRRLLDKSYVTNSLIYTGAHHSMIYIYTLCKDFDFVVTHSTKHHNIPAELDALNEKLKQEEILFDDLDSLLLPKYDNQCSDLTGFPKHFL